jgi:hypothetical protein
MHEIRRWGRRTGEIYNSGPAGGVCGHARGRWRLLDGLELARRVKRRRGGKCGAICGWIEVRGRVWLEIGRISERRGGDSHWIVVGGCGLGRIDAGTLCESRVVINVCIVLVVVAGD